MRNQVFKKLFSVLLALIMAAGLLPASAMAEGWGAMDVDTTPELTETEQPAEPTPGQGEPVAEPTPGQGEPTAEPVPTQGEPTAEPTDEGIMAADVYAAGENNVVLDSEWLNPVPTRITHPNDGFYDGFYRIMFIDNGRKYFSAGSIKQLIDNASAAGFNYLQLAVGNDGMRFLLDDMSLTVNGTTYTSEQVSNAINAGNVKYHDFPTDELNEREMDTIIAYANEKGMGVIPCVNTPGHMDAILYAASSLTGTDCSYSGSARTIDVTNATAVEFTQALLQKYITYFAGKGCKLFNIGADEYANDKFTTGSMGFGNLQQNNKYSYYVQYVNQVAAMVKRAGMIPMAFNDGIYFNGNTSSGTFDTDILICYWSNGWGGYSPMPVSDIVNQGFKVINAHGDYYWVLGKSNWQCSPDKASKFKYRQFQGGTTVDSPAGAMFLIWCDYPGEDTDDNVISKTEATISAFGATLPKPESADITVTDKATGVAVTAKELKEITVNETTAPAITEAAADKVLAYTIALTGENGAIESGKVTVSFPIPDGWDKAKVCGFAVRQTQTRADAAPETIVGQAVGDNYAFEVTLPVGSVGIYQTDAATAETINLTVNGEATREQDGDQTGNLDTTNLDQSIATVKVEYKKSEGSTIRELGKKIISFTTSGTTGVITDNAGNFMVVDNNGKITNATDINNATIFTVTKNSSEYTIKSENDFYLNLTSSAITTSKTQSSQFGFSEGNGFWIQSRWSYYRINCSNAAWGPMQIDNSNFSGAGHLYGFTTKTTEPVDKTVITFTGVAVGTTSVKVGDVTYNIVVTDKAPEGSLTGDSITLEYWITNNMVYDGQTASTNHTKTISKNTEGIETDDGVDMTTLAPNPAYSFFDGTVTVYYWQTMRLDKDHMQTERAGVDQTTAGTSLTHIRYRNGAWQYKTLDGNWHYFVSGDQLVAYYLQKTEVTKEIDTYVKDWGYVTDKTTPDTSSGNGQVALTVAVVYSDGTVSPAEANMYSASTTIFNYWENRDIGIVAPVTKGDYTISKITVTDGARVGNANANVWYSNDTITWNKKTLDSGAEWYDETRVWDKVTNSNTTPMVNGAQLDIRWSAKNTAKLVLIYIEAVVSEDNLNVVYWDDSANRRINPTEIQVVVEEGTTFANGLKDVNDIVIGSTANWPGKKPEDSDYLPDEAYVTNSAGVNQTFNKDITIIDGVAANYRSGIYEYVGANISDDGKTLTLHYNLKEITDKHSFVVDFGLPVKITGLLGWFGVTNVETVENLSLAKANLLTDSTGSWGRAVIDTETNTWDSMTYTLDKMLSATATIPLYCNLTEGVQQLETWIEIIPATSVYYEDSFAKFTGGSGAAADARWTPVGTTNTNTTQALEALGQTGHNPYGYDPAYNNSTTFSMGSACKVTVTSAMAEGWNDTSAWPTAQFTFKGTGFDIISLTDNTSGAIFVDVVNVKTGVKAKSVFVDNYYGYTYDETNGWQPSTGTDPNALYQIPVIAVRGLGYAEYNVVIKVAYSEYFDHTTPKGSYNFWLDAVRVYDPMGASVNTGNTYGQDGEAYPQYIKLRSELANNGTVGVNEKLLFIDGAANATIEQYKNLGPNNEVYLANGQAIMFKLTDNLDKIAAVQIGAKAPMSEGTAKLNVNNTDVVENGLSTATEMYYDITTEAVNNGTAELVTITNTGNGILSLTNLKITFTEGNHTVLLGEVSAEQQTQAVQMVRALFAPAPIEPEPEPEPEKTFEPERFEASWSKNVMQGKKATLTVKTSTDVEAITVDGQLISSYRTRTERVGFGRRAKRITYREFTYSMVAQESADFSVTAINAEGTESEAITARLTVKTRPNSMRDMWDWFKGWF